MMFDKAVPKNKGVLFYKILKYASYVIAAVSVLALALLVFQIFANGLQALNWHFLFGEYDILGDKPSLRPSLVTTAYLILISISIAVPLGVACAIYLTEYTKKGSKFVNVVRMALDILAGLPSIIFALFGILFFCGMLGFGRSVIAGALTMVLVILPPVVRATEEALKAVPDSLREGSLALGAGKVRTVSKVVLPNAIAGIVSAIIISMGRVVGESAVILLTLGGVHTQAPNGVTDPGSSLATTLYKFANTGFRAEAYATGIVLLAIVFSLNLIAYYMEHRLTKKKR
jgi:phosphate transport system permease protein